MYKYLQDHGAYVPKYTASQATRY